MDGLSRSPLTKPQLIRHVDVRAYGSIIPDAALEETLRRLELCEVTVVGSRRTTEVKEVRRRLVRLRG